MSDRHVHPLRRKHRRGKRAGRKHRTREVKTTPPTTAAPVLTLVPTPPAALTSLRARLRLLNGGQAHVA